jgi:hypothetical protein
MLRNLPTLILTFASFAPAAWLPRVDLHVHIHDEDKPSDSMKPADAAALSQKLNVHFGVLAEGGCAGDIHDDKTLGAFLDSMKGMPMWRGLQVYGFEWRRCLSAKYLDQLDYIAADALVFPWKDGKNVWLWLPGVKFDGPQEFMDRYVDYNVRVISQRIQVWTNPTFLPESMQSDYDALWTPERMDRVISAAVKNHVAIEINARYHIPSLAFLRRAKAAGAKFSFGSNRHVHGIGEIEYCLKTAADLGLAGKDIYVPSRPLTK